MFEDYEYEGDHTDPPPQGEDGPVTLRNPRYVITSGFVGPRTGAQYRLPAGGTVDVDPADADKLLAGDDGWERA